MHLDEVVSKTHTYEAAGGPTAQFKSYVAFELILSTDPVE
jgi:hypothetical protein